MKKSLRFLSVLLALALCFTGMAVSAFAEGEGDQEPADTPSTTPECICQGDACYPGFVNAECPVCSAPGFTADQCKQASTHTCICPDHCVDYRGAELRRPRCYYCWDYYKGNTARLQAACQGQEKPTQAASDKGEEKFRPDVSGKYRTTPERIKDKLKPADIAQQTLYIDEATNTILNLYDADGNLITATLSSDGHFYIVPDSSGNYVYIPTGK